MVLRKSISCILILICVRACLGEYFIVFGPRTIMFKKNLEIIISHDLDFDKATLVTFDLETTGGDEIIKLAKEFSGINNTLVVFDLEDRVQAADLTLTVTCGNPKLNETFIINTTSSNFITLIQTDKSVYKPEDLLLFRVLVLDVNKMPFSYESLNVKIIDAEGLNIFDIQRDESELVLEGNFTIPKNVRFGNWTIKVIVDDNQKLATQQTFEVKEYVLPFIEVFIDTKKFITSNDPDIVLDISAKYTFGDYVRGKAKVTAQVIDSEYPDKVIKIATFHISDVKTQKRLVMNLKNDLDIKAVLRDVHVKIEAEFEDEVTGKKAKMTKTVTIAKKGDFLIDVKKPSPKFKPGFPYELQVFVLNPDGTTMETNAKIVFNIKTHLTSPRCTRKGDAAKAIKMTEFTSTKHLNSGKTTLLLNPSVHATAIEIEIKHFTTSKKFNILGLMTESREYLNAKVDKKFLKVNEKVNIEVVKRKDETDYDPIFCVVMGRHGIISRYTFKPQVKLVNDTTIYDVSFVATSEMAPAVEVFLYFIHYSGEIIFDKVELNFENELPNNLEVKLKKSVLKPKQEMSLTFKTTSESTVYLMAIDRSVNLLGIGHDIDKDKVLKKSTKATLHDDANFGKTNLFVMKSASSYSTICIAERLDVSEQELEYNHFEHPDVEETLDDELKRFNSTIRDDFPETWIFRKYETDQKGLFLLKEKVPDTITSWDITAFTVSKENGFGIATPQKLIVKQDFFIKMQLPYSVRVGEILKVEATVFSFFGKQKEKDFLDVEVTLFSEKIVTSSNSASSNQVTVPDEENSDNDETSIFGSDDSDSTSSPAVQMVSQFDFYQSTMSKGICTYAESENDNQNKHSKKSLKVGKSTGVKVHFYVKMNKGGPKTIRLRADIIKNGKALVYDEVHKSIIVETEGLTVYDNQVKIFDLRSKNFDNFHMAADFEIDDKNSIRKRISAIGGFLGPVVVGTDNLIQMPSGCPEQKLVSFVPNIFAWKYLLAINKNTTQLERKIEQHLKQGVADTLVNRIQSGSDVGAFTFWDKSGKDSIWLTAYIVKCFGLASRYTSIDSRYIVGALNHLGKHQGNDGKFPERGDFELYSISDRSNKGIALTAFVTVAFLENKNITNDGLFQTNIDNALSYINQNRKSSDDNYSFAIATYALALGGHASANSSLDSLKEKSKISDKEMFWEETATTLKGKSNPAMQNEIAAYALLAFLKMEREQDAFKIVNWLIPRRNAGGGFVSTQDTVMCLEALAEFAIRYHSKNLNMTIKVKNNDKFITELRLIDQNYARIEGLRIPHNLNNISFTASGSGIASVQVETSYKRSLNVSNGPIELTVHVTPSTGPKVLELKVCTKFVSSAEVQAVATGMALMEVTLPSGYQVDPDFDLLDQAEIRQFDLQHQNSVVELYFDSITTTEICPVIRAIRVSQVELLKASPVKVYDYYHKSNILVKE